MTPGSAPPEERIAIALGAREWGVVAALVAALLALAPSLHLRPKTPALEPDYRMPFPLSARYEIYQRMSTLQAEQFPTLLIGDSVIWGQCAHRDRTLSHYLNALTHESRFANTAMSGLHPIALEGLIEHHAPAIRGKNVVLHLDPLWLMASEDRTRGGLVFDSLFNRPGLIPRLAADYTAGIKDAASVVAARLLRRSPLAGWAERFADVRVDFLAWSLDHPYESPMAAIASGLPPPDDSHGLRLAPANPSTFGTSRHLWSVLSEDGQWLAFLRLVDLLEHRLNRVFVLVGPMNEWMMAPEMSEGYQALKRELELKLKDRGLPYFICPNLPCDQYGDLCHPLGSGYEVIARELLRAHSDWLLHPPRPQ